MDGMKVRVANDYLSNLPSGGSVFYQEDGNSDRQWVVESDSLSITLHFDPPLGEEVERKIVNFLADGSSLLRYLLEEVVRLSKDHDDLLMAFQVVFNQLKADNNELQQALNELMKEDGESNDDLSGQVQD
jgi:hypothetical protein